MKLFEAKEERQPQQFYLYNGRPPLDGQASSLAGVAEPGDRLDALGHGSYVNVGSKASPRWQKLGTAAPTSSEGSWSQVEQPATDQPRRNHVQRAGREQKPRR